MTTNYRIDDGSGRRAFLTQEGDEWLSVEAAEAKLRELAGKAALADEMALSLEGLKLEDGEVLLVFRHLDDSKFWHDWLQRYDALQKGER